MAQSTIKLQIASNKVHDLSQFLNTSNSAPIKFNAASNSIDTRAQNHHMLIMELNIMTSSIVSEVQIVSDSRPLGSYSVNLLYTWPNSQLLAQLSNCCFRAVKLHILDFSTILLLHNTFEKKQERSFHKIWKNIHLAGLNILVFASIP